MVCKMMIATNLVLASSGRLPDPDAAEEHVLWKIEAQRESSGSSNLTRTTRRCSRSRLASAKLSRVIVTFLSVLVGQQLLRVEEVHDYQ